MKTKSIKTTPATNVPGRKLKSGRRFRHNEGDCLHQIHDCAGVGEANTTHSVYRDGRAFVLVSERRGKRTAERLSEAQAVRWVVQWSFDSEFAGVVLRNLKRAR